MAKKLIRKRRKIWINKQADTLLETVGAKKMLYKTYLETSHWKKTRLRRLSRDGFQCVKCEKKRNLQVHHLTYERLGCEHLKDIITLCRSCHKKEHGTKVARKKRAKKKAKRKND